MEDGIMHLAHGKKIGVNKKNDMKKALIVIGSLLAVGGIGFLSYKLFFAKKTPKLPGKDDQIGSKKDNTRKSISKAEKSAANLNEVKQSVLPIKTFHPGDLVFIATGLTDSLPLFIYSRATTNDQKIGSARPSWYGTQSIGKFKAFSTDKKFVLVTFNDFQIWEKDGDKAGKITGDYFVPTDSISTSPY